MLDDDGIKKLEEEFLSLGYKFEVAKQDVDFEEMIYGI